MTDEAPVPEFTGRASRSFRVLIGASMVLTLAAVVAGAVLEDDSPWVAVLGSGVLVAIYGLIAWAFGTVTLRVEPGEVVVLYGRSPIRSRFRHDQIRDVDVEHVGFWTYGGLGYRGSRRLVKRAALVIRPGPCVRLHLADGTTFAASVDDTDRAVAAVRRAQGQQP